MELESLGKKDDLFIPDDMSILRARIAGLLCSLKPQKMPYDEFSTKFATNRIYSQEAMIANIKKILLAHEFTEFSGKKLKFYINREYVIFSFVRFELSAEIASVFEYWLKRTNAKIKMTEEHRSIIESRLESFSVKDLKLAIYFATSKKSWWRLQGQTSLRQIFKDDEIVLSLRNQGVALAEENMKNE